MPQIQMAKAVLIPMNGDQVETDSAQHIPVQFNPATLRVTLSNTLRAENRGGGSAAAAQYVDKSESSLAVELLFDTSRDFSHTAVYDEGDTSFSNDFRVEANSDVRRLTRRIADTFMQPQNPDSDRPGAPRRCRFQWGSFRFTGMLSNYTETLDFFAPEGIPLRATLALTFKEDRYQFDLDASVRAGARGAPAFAPGGPGVTTDRAVQTAGGDPRDWQAVASANDIENPRFTPPGGLLILTSGTGGQGAGGVLAGALAMGAAASTRRR